MFICLTVYWFSSRAIKQINSESTLKTQFMKHIELKFKIKFKLKFKTRR